MFTYVTSTIGISDWEEENRKKLDSKTFIERLLLLPSDFEFSQNPIIKKDILYATIREPVTLSFSFFAEGHIEVYLDTKIAILLRKPIGLTITSPRGIGILARGNARRYIDTTIGPIITKALLKKEGYYHPLELPENLTNWQEWGNELRKIKVDIADFGKLSFTGREIHETLKTNNELNKLILRGEIDKFTIFSNSIKRVVDVSKRGVIKIQAPDIKTVTEYVASIYKDNI